LILVTVGTQLPFDRLIRAVDDIVPQFKWPGFAQIGKGAYQPKNLKWSSNVSPVEFDGYFRECRVIVAHAGIGTVLTARRFGKPIILFPRKASLGEHRNDHQLATVSQLEGRPGIYVARSENELHDLLSSDIAAPAADEVPSANRELLVSYLKNYITSR
jgi:UDP-N-acetylglucosamine transferase subunit ALG13